MSTKAASVFHRKGDQNMGTSMDGPKSEANYAPTFRRSVIPSGPKMVVYLIKTPYLTRAKW